MTDPIINAVAAVIKAEIVAVGKGDRSDDYMLDSGIARALAEAGWLKDPTDQAVLAAAVEASNKKDAVPIGLVIRTDIPTEVQ